jgi:hypothetical protein
MRKTWWRFVLLLVTCQAFPWVSLVSDNALDRLSVPGPGTQQHEHPVRLSKTFSGTPPPPINGLALNMCAPERTPAKNPAPKRTPSNKPAPFINVSLTVCGSGHARGETVWTYRTETCPDGNPIHVLNGTLTECFSWCELACNCQGFSLDADASRCKFFSSACGAGAAGAKFTPCTAGQTCNYDLTDVEDISSTAFETELCEASPMSTTQP